MPSYVHEVFVSDKINKGDTLQTAASQPHGGIALYRDILANVLESSSEGGTSSISHADKSAPAISLESRGDDKSSDGKVNTLSTDKQISDEESSPQHTDDKGVERESQAGGLRSVQAPASETAKETAKERENLSQKPAENLRGDGYNIEPKPYTNKQGKTLDTYLVKFDRDFSKEELSAMRAKAKELKGWRDKESGGWMLRSADDAKAFAEEVMSKSAEEIEDEAPLSMTDLDKDLDKPTYKSDKPTSKSQKPAVKKVDVEGLMGDLKGASIVSSITGGAVEVPLSDHATPVEPPKPKKRSKWISEEDADEFNSLRDGLRNHLGADDNVAHEDAPSYGKPQPKQMDAEVLRMGTRMTYLMMKGGLRKFSDYAEAMVEEVGDAIRPHLKSLYAAAQNMEEVMELGWDEEMDDRKTVKAFDVYNFDKPGAKDIIETAQHTVDERESQKQTEQIVEQIKQQRNEQRKQEADKTSADTEAIAGKAEATASKVESELKDAKTEEDADRLNTEIDKQLEEVNKQLALLGEYNKGNEAYNERHAESDAAGLMARLANDLGIDLGEAAKEGQLIRANFGPKHGYVSITLPLKGYEPIKIEISFAKLGKGRVSLEIFSVRRTITNSDSSILGGGTDIKMYGHRTTYRGLLNGIREQFKAELEALGVKPTLSPRHGEDYVDMAGRVAKQKEKDTQVTMGSLFDFEDEAEVSKQITDAVKSDLNTPAKTEDKPKPKEELSGTSIEYQERSEKERDLVDDIRLAIVDRITNANAKPLTMAEVRKMAEEKGITEIPPTDLQELVERAVSLDARAIAELALSKGKIHPRDGFDRVVSLYEKQPMLTDRDSERVAKQQYSTPVPMGYVMNQFLLADGFKGKRLLEPSAGNGALTIGIPMEMCHVNDIDARRLANLRAMGYPHVTNQDGTQPFAGQFDMVATNPPFGSMTPKQYGLFTIETLEGQMAINALQSLSDNGRTAIIIGGSIGKWPTPYRSNGSLEKLADRQLFGYLYSHFNVVDIIPIDGKRLYARNGTGYNVRMILIDGRRRDANGEVIREATKENRAYPPVMKDARAEAVTTFEELYNRVQDDISRLQTRLDEPVRPNGGTGEADSRHDREDTPAVDSRGSGERQRPVGTSERSGTSSRLGGMPTESGNTKPVGTGKSGSAAQTGQSRDADAGGGNRTQLDARTDTKEKEYSEKKQSREYGDTDY